MTINIDPLLNAISEASPCGENLEYDADFLALEESALGKAEQQFGDTIIPAQEPDWSDIKQRSEKLLTRSKDLRVAVLLLRAYIRTEGINGLTAGITLVFNLLERYWDNIHPQLDEGDASMRMNSLAPLSDAATVLRDVRDLLFIPSLGPLSKVTIRDILVVLGKLPANQSTLTLSDIETCLKESHRKNLVPVTQIKTTLQLTKQIAVFTNEKVGSENAPDLSVFVGILYSVAQLCDKVLGVEEVIAAQETTGEVQVDLADDQSMVKTSSSLKKTIENREDALKMLDHVCDFLERSEPSNPAPLFIRRAQQLMSKSFVEIIEELAPDSLSQIQRITGLK